jgi:hypothetical protein
MADKLGISARSVIRGLAVLIEWNIISKERERREDATWLNNRYTLLDKSVWKPKPSATQSDGSQVTIKTEPSDKNDASQVPHSHTKVSTYKDTQEKDTHPPEIPIFIELFSLINPSYKILYPRPPQRNAAARLLKLHDLEWWRRFMPAYQQALEDRYCPRATTPVQLEEKIGAIEHYGRSKKSEKLKGNNFII